MVGVLVDVKLDKLHVELPEASPQGLQDLGQPEYIRVGYRRRDKDPKIVLPRIKPSKAGAPKPLHPTASGFPAAADDGDDFEDDDDGLE